MVCPHVDEGDCLGACVKNKKRFVDCASDKVCDVFSGRRPGKFLNGRPWKKKHWDRWERWFDALERKDAAARASAEGRRSTGIGGKGGSAATAPGQGAAARGFICSHFRLETSTALIVADPFPFASARSSPSHGVYGSKPIVVGGTHLAGIPLLEASGTSTDGTIAATSDMETTTTSDSTATEATSNDATTFNATTNETAKASEDSVIIDPNGIGTEAATATASEDGFIRPMCIEAMSKTVSLELVPKQRQPSRPLAEPKPRPSKRSQIEEAPRFGEGHSRSSSSTATTSSGGGGGSGGGGRRHVPRMIPRGSVARSMREKIPRGPGLRSMRDFGCSRSPWVEVEAASAAAQI